MPSFSLSAPSLPLSLPLFFSVSHSAPSPRTSEELGERRSEVTSSASATFLQREGGARGEREGDGDWEEEGEEDWEAEEEENVPKLFEVTGSPSPHLPPSLPHSLLPRPLKHTNTTDCCSSRFFFSARLKVRTGSSSSSCAPSFNSCASPSCPPAFPSPTPPTPSLTPHPLSSSLLPSPPTRGMQEPHLELIRGEPARETEGEGGGRGKGVDGKRSNGSDGSGGVG